MMEYKLPDLPEPWTEPHNLYEKGKYTAIHMRQYAEQAVAPLLAEIERLEKLCQEKYKQGYDEGHDAGYDWCAGSMLDD